MTTTMKPIATRSAILEGKNAVVFGAGGTIGAAVAKEFAAEGANVFLAGRTKSKLEHVATQLAESGGRAHINVVDTLDDAAVNQYLDGVVKQGGQDRHHSRCRWPPRERVREHEVRSGFAGRGVPGATRDNGEVSLRHRPNRSTSDDQTALRRDHSRDR